MLKNRILMVALALAATCTAFGQKYDRDNLDFNNTHLPSKLIYDQIKTFGYNANLFNSDPSLLSPADVTGMTYQFRSFDRAEYDNADMKINYTVGPFSFVGEKTVSRKTEEEVNKVKVTVTKYKRVYEFKYPIRVTVVNAKNNVQLWGNEYSSPSVRSIESYEFNSEAEAVAYFDKAKGEALKNHLVAHVKDFVGRANNAISDQYDFYPASTILNIYQFKKWDRDDEYNQHVEHVKQVFKNMTAGENPAQYKEKLKNDIAYFQQFEGVFKADDKKEDILYFGNYFNLATIFYCLDDMEKAGFYIAKLDSSDKKEGPSTYMKNAIFSAKFRMEKHLLTTTHLDYNPVKDYRLADKKFTSDALSAAQNMVNSLGTDGLAKAADEVKFTSGSTLKGKVIFYAESKQLKLLPAHKPDSVVVLNPENTLAFTIDTVKYFSCKYKSAGTVIKQFFKVVYQSNKIALMSILDGSLNEYPEKIYATIRPSDEVANMLYGNIGYKKAQAAYFEDCEVVSKKAKDGEYGAGVTKNFKDFLKMCEDYTQQCGGNATAGN